MAMLKRYEAITEKGMFINLQPIYCHLFLPDDKETCHWILESMGIYEEFPLHMFHRDNF